MSVESDRVAVRPASRPRPQAFASRREILDKLEVSDQVYDRTRRDFPVQWPSYYLGLVERVNDPIARMGRPSPEEWQADAGDLADPIADLAQRPVPFVVRKHPDRVIVLAAKRCHFYCRFCFRRVESVAKTNEPTPADWERIFTFLTEHPEIEEAILSGGDPLTLADTELFLIRDRLAAIAGLKRWRIHTRAPVHFPARLTPELVRGLGAGLPLRIATHFNHVREITRETGRIAHLLAAHGIELMNQAVLLRGVNDHPEEQIKLWEGLVALGIRPHYLHHPDRTPGNAAFRLTITEGRRVYRSFLSTWHGPAPRYVLDLPDGKGKVPVAELAATAPGHYAYIHPDGTVSTYRDFM